MEIRIELFDREYSLCFGYKTGWFVQDSFFTLIRSYRDGDDRRITFAELIYRS